MLSANIDHLSVLESCQERIENTPPQYCNYVKSSILQKAFVLLVIILASLFCFRTASARQFGIKTNILYDATATINVGAELKVAPRWSIDLSGNLNAWTFSNGSRWKHLLIQPEARYWLCEATVGHFFAVHALGGIYNIGHLGFARDIAGVRFGELRHHRYQGDFIGAGIGYGYAWTLNAHWSVEAEIAAGWTHFNYDKYECEGCGKKTGHSSRNFIAPTKAAISIVYVF